MSDIPTAHDFRDYAGPAAGDQGPVPSPEAPAAPPDYTCEECGRSFESANALNGHLKSHRVKKVPCPECGNMYMAGVGIAVHRKSRHGVESESPRSKNRQARVRDERVACPEPGCGSIMRKDNLGRHMQTVHHREILVVNEEWSVEDIFDTVVSMLWPTGQMPVKAMNPLIAWREATAKMLVEVGPHE